MNKIETKFYDSLEIPLYNWDRFTATHDNNWFIVGYDGRQEKVDTPELKEVEELVMDEYFKAVDDKSFRSKLQKWARISEIKLKYNIVSKIVDRCWEGFTKDQEEERYKFFEILGKYGYKMKYISGDPSEDAEQLIIIKSVLEGLETKVNILMAELKEDGSRQKSDLIKQLRIATIAMGFSQRLKVKDLTLIEWIDICKGMEELSVKN
jgi:hypothetical protein